VPHKTHNTNRGIFILYKHFWVIVVQVLREPYRFIYLRLKDRVSLSVHLVYSTKTCAIFPTQYIKMKQVLESLLLLFSDDTVNAN
jgi:hypothetical protein